MRETPVFGAVMAVGGRVCFFFSSLFINSYSSLLFYVHYLKNNNAKP